MYTKRKPRNAPSLPANVPMRALMTPCGESLDRRRFDIGLDPNGQPQGVRAPHALVAGLPASGKTVALRMMAAQALARGHEVIAITPWGPDFRGFAAYLKRIVNLYDEADVPELRRIEGEMHRRYSLLREHGAHVWSSLPAELREAERIHPLTVIIDEPGHFDPAISAVGRELRELATGISTRGRAAGVEIFVATGDLGFENLPSSLSTNLGSRILAVSPGSQPSEVALRSMFGHLAPQASDLLAQWNYPDRVRGLALVSNGHNGHEIHAVQVGYASENETSALLSELLIPPGSPGFPAFDTNR